MKIMVATHKQYVYPISDIYFPIQAGKAEKDAPELGVAGDDTGDNISSIHAYYSELSCLYWAWKNLKCNYLGLIQYRRWFVCTDEKGKRRILNRDDIEHSFLFCDVILPKRLDLGKESIRDHFNRCHIKDDMDAIEEIIRWRYPDYMDAFQRTMKRNWGYFTNMFIMKKELADEYSEWIFGIIDILKTQRNMNDYTGHQTRVFGYLAERLFNVWVEHKQLKIGEYETRCYGKESASQELIEMLYELYNTSKNAKMIS